MNRRSQDRAIQTSAGTPIKIGPARRLRAPWPFRPANDNPAPPIAQLSRYGLLALLLGLACYALWQFV